MIALDTNILVRLITDDDEDQAARAEALIKSEQVFVPLTVFLEAEWVLRQRLGFGPERVVTALLAFADIPTVSLEERSRVLDALRWAAAGMDFADALHLASSSECRGMASFDRRFKKRAARVGASPPVVEP